MKKIKVLNTSIKIVFALLVVFSLSCKKDTCRGKPPKNIACPDSGISGVPVCGCDGNTYFSPCYAREKGIYEYTEGACE